MRVRAVAASLLAALLALSADAQDATPPEVAVVVAKLSDPDAAVRMAACDELAGIGAAAVPAVVAALADEKRRAGAVETVARMGPLATSAIPALVTIAQDVASPLRAEAAHALGTLGGSGVAAYLPLSSVLTEADAPARAQSAAAIAIVRIALAAANPVDTKPAKPASVEAAVQSGLDWLARHQEIDGRWSVGEFGKRCSAPGECWGAGEAAFDPGVTGLATLAFLGAGETQFQGPHAANLRSALAYLRRVQDAEGCVGQRACRQFMYDHAIGALALTDAYRRTGSPVLAESVRRALEFSLAQRNPGMAWSYFRGDGVNDTSVSVWNAKVLATAADAGLDVDPAAMDGALKWIDIVTEKTTGRAGYRQRGEVSQRSDATLVKFPPDETEALTAAALVTRLSLGRTRGDDPFVAMGEKLLAKRTPYWGAIGGGTDLYYWMLGAEALHRLGGPTWELWRETLPVALVPNQVTGKRCTRGSWHPGDPWAVEGGRIWMTCAAVLALEPCSDDAARRPVMPPGLRSCTWALEKAAKSNEAAVRLAARRALETIRGAYR